MTSTPAGHRLVPSLRRLGPATVAAVAVPLVALVAALLVDTGTPPAPAQPPERRPLTRSTVVCPPGGASMQVTTASGEAGSVEVRRPGSREQVQVAPGRVTRLRVGDDPAIVRGLDELAPGLVASRFATPLAGVDCAAPTVEQWFTGVGAGARHSSRLQLVNPDGGLAVVDVTILGRNGPVEAPELSGVAVPGGEVRTFDLSAIVPRRDDLAMRVTTVRGRVSASVLDEVSDVPGVDEPTRDGLAGQAAPSTGNLLLGLPAGSGLRTLVLANPGADQGRAVVKLVTPDSVFTPQGADEVVLPPRSVVRVPLTQVLGDAGVDENEPPLGLQVESTVPVTASVLMVVDGDLAHAVPVSPTGEDGATTPLPAAASRRLVLAGADRDGTVVVDTWDERGRRDRQRVEVAPGRGQTLDLPPDARLLRLRARRGGVSAVVVASRDSGGGTTVVRPREPRFQGLEPQVRPALP